VSGLQVKLIYRTVLFARRVVYGGACPTILPTIAKRIFFMEITKLCLAYWGRLALRVGISLPYVK
jgi:hypothetical protein